jgi:hypothetical protein
MRPINSATDFSRVFTISKFTSLAWRRASHQASDEACVDFRTVMGKGYQALEAATTNDTTKPIFVLGAAVIGLSLSSRRDAELLKIVYGYSVY